jgi:serine/threonine-protein kinase
MDGARLRASNGDAAAAAREDPFAQSLLGRVLDRRYRLDEVIGLGGMGVVFRATHVLIGKVLAVKVLRREHTHGDVARRFLLEARVASSLKHPNVVDISDFGELEEGGAFYVMEYLEGRSLADRIDHDGPIPPDEAIAIALQICQGLTAAHAQGVVHRDLKPDNVFLVPPGSGSEAPLVKLLDFGIARAGPRRITAMGTVLGTPEYMAPEQALGVDVDHRVDLYSLGIILFEMLTASVPFHHKDIAQVLEMHVSAEAPHLGARKPELAPLQRVDDVVQSLLAKSRETRPSSAEATVTALISAIGLDLGRDTADRLQRATIAIGSGLISDVHEATPTSIRSEPTSWRGKTRAGERPAAPDPLLLSGPVPTVGRHGASLRPAPSPARPVLIATVAAVLAAAVTFVFAQWLRDRDAEPTSVPAGARPAPLTPARAIPSATDPPPRSERPPGVTPITEERTSATSTVTSPSVPTSDGSPSLARPPGSSEPPLEPPSSRDDKAAKKGRSKTGVPGDTTRGPPATPSPTSGPSEADSAPTPSPQPAPDPKPSGVPGDLKDPFPAN